MLNERWPEMTMLVLFVAVWSLAFSWLSMRGATR